MSSPLCSIEVHSLGFAGFTDTAYANNPSDLKSTSGYIFKFASGPISWRSRKQSITATLSIEAKYIDYSLASKEAIWLCHPLLDLGYDSLDTQIVSLYSDNKPAIALSGNTEFHSRTKHIAIQYHNICEQIRAGLIKLAYVNTRDMPIDELTKPLQGIKFSRFVDLIGLHRAPTLQLPSSQ